jgi:hypothetical protein
MSHRKYEFRSINLKDANKFVGHHHRHSKAVQGHKYSLCLVDKKTSDRVGVVIIGRPLSRYLDDGKTLEITRLCVIKNKKNVCSMLYGRAAKIAFLMGFETIITYTLEKEEGISLKASGFDFDGLTKWSKGWSIRNGKQLTLTGQNKIPEGNKKRWIKRSC